MQTATRPFVKDSDCPAHDTRCTEHLCILEKAHPLHGDYLAAEWRRHNPPLLAPSPPKRELAGWLEDEPGEWVRAKCSEDRVTMTDGPVGIVCIHCDGTYGEGGHIEVPLPVLTEVLRHAGYDVVPVRKD